MELIWAPTRYREANLEKFKSEEKQCLYLQCGWIFFNALESAGSNVSGYDFICTNLAYNLLEYKKMGNFRGTDSRQFFTCSTKGWF